MSCPALAFFLVLSHLIWARTVGAEQRDGYTGIAKVGDEVVRTILLAVRSYDAFTQDNDPYGEHDFDSFHFHEHQVFWKWDYYDLDSVMHSPDSADEAVTARVLTVMLTEE